MIYIGSVVYVEEERNKSGKDCSSSCSLRSCLTNMPDGGAITPEDQSIHW